MRLDFIAKMRDEIAFEYVDDLVAQMQVDVESVRILDDPCFTEVELGRGRREPNGG